MAASRACHSHLRNLITARPFVVLSASSPWSFPIPQSPRSTPWHRARIEKPGSQGETYLRKSADGKAPAEKYNRPFDGSMRRVSIPRPSARIHTSGLCGSRAESAPARRSAECPMASFSGIKRRVVNELPAFVAAMAQSPRGKGPRRGSSRPSSRTCSSFWPALKQIRDKWQDTLTANSVPWEAPQCLAIDRSGLALDVFPGPGVIPAASGERPGWRVPGRRMGRAHWLVWPR